MADTPLSVRIGASIVGAVAVVIGMLIASGMAIRTYRSATPSMEPALPNGTHLVVRRTDEVRRGDIIVFRYPQDPRVTYVKRAVAIEGDVVEIRAKKLFVNGRAVDEPYVMHEDTVTYPNEPSMPEPYRSRDHFGPYRVPAKQYFMLGDNRDRSADSRYWGTVAHDLVIGRVVLVYSWKGGARRIPRAPA